ncbi:hypothetical protein QP173_09085, partial [Aerococcus urinae]
ALGGMTSAITSIASVALASIGPAAILGLVVAGLGLINNAFGDQISQMLTTVTQKGPEVIARFTQGIVSAIPQLIQSGTQLIAQFAQALAANIPAIVQAGV